MKRRCTKIVAVLAALTMLISLIPATAVAANSTYKLTVTITDSGEGATGNRLIDSASYLTSNTNLVATIGTLVASNYFLEDGSVNPNTPLRVFESAAMKEKLEKGLRDRADKDDWTNFVNEEMRGAEGDLLPLIADFDTTLAALEPGHEYSVRYTNRESGDTKEGVTYTVTVTLTERSSSSNVSPSKPTVSLVNIKESEDGETALADKYAASTVKVGDTVTIELTPKDGYRTNRVVVKDENGNLVSLTALDNDTYTFVVPKGGVTVTSSFILMPTPVNTTGVDRMLNTDSSTAYIQGKSDGGFHPGDSITRGQVATIFYRLLKEEYANVTQTKNFKDIPDDFWCADAVNTLATLGIVNGMTADEFAPNKPITRAQFVAICARFAEVSATGETFTDVSENYWAYDYISTASGYGWINGVGDGKFAPSAPITRAQAVAIVNRMLCRIADRAAIDAQEEQFYHDVANTYWAWYDIGEASQGDLTRGD